MAANHVFSAAAKDGTIIGLFHEAQMMNQLTGGEGVNFDLRQFNWLGSSYDDPNVCIVRTDAMLTTFKDMIGSAKQIGVGGTGPGSNTYDAPRVLAAATGASLKAVAGYPTTNDVRIGVERGEIQGMCLGWESVKSASSQWLQDGYAKVFVQNGTSRHKDLPDVPLAIEFARDEESSRLLRLVDAPGAMAKPFTLPPGVDPSRVEVMRTALAATYRDQALLDEARAMKLEFQPKTAARSTRFWTTCWRRRRRSLRSIAKSFSRNDVRQQSSRTESSDDPTCRPARVDRAHREPGRAAARLGRPLGPLIGTISEIKYSRKPRPRSSSTTSSATRPATAC